MHFLLAANDAMTKIIYYFVGFDIFEEIHLPFLGTSSFSSSAIVPHGSGIRFPVLCPLRRGVSLAWMLCLWRRWQESVSCLKKGTLFCWRRRQKIPVRVSRRRRRLRRYCYASYGRTSVLWMPWLFKSGTVMLMLKYIPRIQRAANESDNPRSLKELPVQRVASVSDRIWLWPWIEGWWVSGGCLRPEPDAKQRRLEQ